MSCLACFRHDPSESEDSFETDTKGAMIISRNEEVSRRTIRERIEQDEKIEIDREKKERLKLAEEAERNRMLEKDEDVNPHLSIICDGCNSTIEDELYVNALGALWHPQCLCCLHCQQPIAIHEISNSKGKFHRHCYKEHRRPNCYICREKIQGTKYNFHPFWKEKYCPSHEYDGTAKCFSCERLEPCGTKYVMLDDGRWLCGECMECAVTDTYECHQLHLEIREFFEGLNMKIEKEFPLLLVGKEALNTEEEEKIENHYGVVTRGICLCEEQNVPSVSKGPKMGPNKQLIGMATESQWVVRQCEVIAILILYGLPRLLAGYILAHEMMHAYLRLKGYRNLDIVLEEGICQVLGHMWLESESYAPIDPAAASSSSNTPPQLATTSKKGDQSDFEKKLVEFCKYQIETDDSPTYGLGFKKVNQMMVLNNYSLKDTLRDIQR